MQRRRKRLPAIILLLGGIVVFFLLWSRAGTVGVRSLFTPVVRGFHATGTWMRGIPSFFENRADLRRENERLTTLLGQKSVEESRLALLERENIELKALLEYQTTAAYDPIVTRVIGYAKDPFREAIFIDRGEADGIRVGAPMLVRDGVFAGVVVEVWEHTALGLLARDQRAKFPAKVLGRENAVGVLEGHGVLYHLTLIPRDTLIEVGDTVVTETFGTNIPPGLAVGTTTAIQDSEESPFKTALVEPLASFDDLSFIMVLPISHLPQE